MQTNFSFDGGGNCVYQIKERIVANDSRQLAETLYLGSYEREIHDTKATASASPIITSTAGHIVAGGVVSVIFDDKFQVGFLPAATSGRLN